VLLVLVQSVLCTTFLGLLTYKTLNIFNKKASIIQLRPFLFVNKLRLPKNIKINQKNTFTIYINKLPLRLEKRAYLSKTNIIKHTND